MKITSILSRKHKLCLVVAPLLHFLFPDTGIAHHVSIGRWLTADCFVGQEIEIFQDNANYAISIKGKDQKKVMLPLKLNTKDLDGTLVFEEERKEKSIEPFYKVYKNRTLQIYLNNEIKCTGKPLTVKGGSVLN